ncbi:tetraacyldisaccharide 4'-kinase [Ferrovibrio xuzhouensis]|uniref:Tetraacyldisaccharide 4'-kinase n=1 Tax=Ferrovibrio xuzhouensis TaxID=1576914 RepID=A0ABV7V9T0_9PROT
MPSTPAFWAAGQSSPWPALLAPAAVLYGLGNRLNRALAHPQDCGLPVISVGNLVAGGAGKTPTTLALARLLDAAGRRPHLLTRGYGGSLAGPVQVDPTRHDAAAVGDEALLLAATAPTWVSRDRPAGARAAKAAGAGCVIADDAHQTWALARRLSLLVFDGSYGIGNGRLLPAGPLREPVAEGLARTDAVVVIGPATGPLPDFGRLPVFAADLQPDAEDAARLRGRRVLAFAGIGRPEKFFASLERLGAEIVQRQAFADHAPYAPDSVMRLAEAAQQQDALPVTTAKDHVRLPAEARAMIDCLRVELRFAAPDTVTDFFGQRLDHG